VDAIMDQVVDKVYKTQAAQKDVERIPRNVPSDMKSWETVAYDSWVSGFWPGLLWYMYDYTGDEEWREIAHERNLPVAKVLTGEKKDHDLGFQFFCSFGNGYRLTGNPHYKEYLFKAAGQLAGMAHPRVGTILSWPHAKDRYKTEHNTIIDNLMNLELLFWVARNGGNPAYYEIARTHARVTMENQIRPDYTHWHVVVYDTETGKAVQKVTRQGYSNESLWARGQAWGIYGFAMIFRETREREFLRTAKRIADVFLERLPEDHVPFWDFDAPDIPDAPRDASAAAIAASGLLELSELVEEGIESKKYYTAAVRMLASLWENYAAPPDSPAILGHSVGNYPRGKEVDIPIIYGDYYFIEALLKLRDLEQRRHPQ
jgi:unsaturated chondroitin disaccharide hydrolase